VKWVKEISDIELFDLYQWSNLGEWKKSIAVKIKISWDWNLTTEWINEIMNKAIKAWEKAWWKLRG
jgi:phenylalanyl-tRNA synthetase beta subunit